ncbi:MAG TPA: AgmX/PglI C-terminal domain-containing protein [Gammaproteobacteria bacterium]
MSEQLSEKELQLERELAQEKQKLEELRTAFEFAEDAYSGLRKKQSTARLLDQVCNHLAELAQVEPLDEQSPFTGEILSGPDQVNRHYAGLIERVKHQIGVFKAGYAQAEAQFKSMQEALSAAQAKVDQVGRELDKARPAVRTRKIVQLDSDGVERAYIVIYRRDTVMPWEETPRDRQRFRRVLRTVTLLMLLLSIVLPFLPVPELEPAEVTEIPERIARLVEQRKPPPPPPPQVAEKKPEPEEQKEELKPRKQAPEPKTEVAKAAREKAQRSGLLAFSDSFADLMDNPADELLGKQARVTSGGETARRTERSLITASATQGSGGINTAALSRDVAGSGLEGRGTSRVTGVIGDEFGDADRPLADSVRGSRTDEEIQLVFDRNKSALYAIYQRELRRDPTLRGKIVLRITIAPSGKVTASVVESSDLNHPELEQKIATRVKLFDFGAKDVPAITISYPIDFLPA